MLPLDGPTCDKIVRRLFKLIKDEEELVKKMKEHDYSECYCIALTNPPWGGYSNEEQILHEAKQRKKGGRQGKLQNTGTSSYTYLNRDQAAILGEAAILQTTKSIFILLLPELKLTCRRLQPDLFSKIGTTQLEHASTSKVAPAHTTSVVAAVYQISTDVFQINESRRLPRRDTLQHHQQSRPARARHPLGGFQTLHHSNWPCAVWQPFPVGKTPLSHSRTRKTHGPVRRLYHCSYCKKQVLNPSLLGS